MADRLIKVVDGRTITISDIDRLKALITTVQSFLEDQITDGLSTAVAGLAAFRVTGNAKAYYDRKGLIARDGVPAVYLPLKYSASRQPDASATALVATNTASSQMPGYTRFTLDLSANTVTTVVYDLDTNTLVKFTSGAAPAPAFHVFSVRLDGFTAGNGIEVVEWDAVLGSNQCEHGRNMADLPRRFGSGDFASIGLAGLNNLASENVLSALGLETGVTNGIGNAIAIGDNLDQPMRGGVSAFRLYVFSSTGIFPPVVNIYLRNAAGVSLGARRMTLEKAFTSYLQSYVLVTDLPTDVDAGFYYAGFVSTAGLEDTRISLWGLQHSASERAVAGVWIWDYPLPGEADEDDGGAAPTGVSQALARYRMKARMLKSGLTQDQQGDVLKLNVVAGAADSLTDRKGWISLLLPELREELGDGGAGTIRFFGGSGIAAAEDITAGSGANYAVTTTGTWTITDPGASADLGSVVDPASSVFLTSGVATAAASVTVTAKNDAAIKTQTVVKLLFVPHAGASVQYSFDGGSTWTTLNVNSGGAVLLTGSLAHGGAVTVRWNGGMVELNGLACWNADPGIVFHKTALAGSQSPHWETASDTSTFQVQHAALNPDLSLIYLGTNDGGMTPAEYGSAITAIVENMRTAKPWAGEMGQDILLIGPTVNLTASGPTMASFQGKLLEMADGLGAGFRNLQEAFPLDEDGTAAPYGALTDGAKHYLYPSGYAAVAATIERALNDSGAPLYLSAGDTTIITQPGDVLEPREW